jgi:general secretion pathway protein J
VTGPEPPRDNGLTLIELAVAMLIFALVAVMGLQALTGMLRMRDRLAGIDENTAELSLALSLLRSDLSAMVPLVFHAPQGGVQSALTLEAGGREVAFSVGGQPDLAPVSGLGLHRVEWRWNPEDQTLSRRIWPVLAPASAAAAMPEMVVLGDVTGLALRSYWPEVGWQQGAQQIAPSAAVASDSSPLGAVDRDTVLRAVVNSYTDQLPQAVEITVRTARYGPISLVESLR